MGRHFTELCTIEVLEGKLRPFGLRRMQKDMSALAAVAVRGTVRPWSLIVLLNRWEERVSGRRRQRRGWIGGLNIVG